MSYDHVKNSRQRLKNRLLLVMGEKCQICGYDRCKTALEFHHINPEEKSFSITENANIGTERAFNEVKKCVLVCANCHREIHAGLIKEELKSSYNEELAKEILENLKNHIVEKESNGRVCSECGKPISQWSTTGLCPVCANKSRRKVERPEREELKNLIRNFPFAQIAREYGVCDKSIVKWCVAENLPSSKSVINAISDEDWEKI